MPWSSARTAIRAVDANDVGAHVTQQARAIWARDVAPEVEHSNAFQDLAHDPPFAWVLAKSLDRAC